MHVHPQCSAQAVLWQHTYWAIVHDCWYDFWLLFLPINFKFFYVAVSKSLLRAARSNEFMNLHRIKATSFFCGHVSGGESQANGKQRQREGHEISWARVNLKCFCGESLRGFSLVEFLKKNSTNF